MTELDLYDRFGDPVGDDGDPNERFEAFDRTDVLLYADTTRSDPILVSSFRAHDRPGGRSNRFYAQFRGDDAETVFEACQQAIHDRVGELGWRLDTSSDNDRVDAFRSLSAVTSAYVTLGDQREHIRHLFEMGQRADFEVHDVRDGVAVLKQFVQDDTLRGTFALGNNGRVPETEDALLVLEPGSVAVDTLRPLGSTASALEAARDDWERRLTEDCSNEVTETLSNAVERLRDRANLNDDELEAHLVRAVNRSFDQTEVRVQARKTSSLRALETERDDLRNESRPVNGDGSGFSGRVSRPVLVVLLLVLLGAAFAAGAVLSSSLVSSPFLEGLLTSAVGVFPVSRF